MYFVLQICLAAVGVVGDLCRALSKNILPFCDEIMVMLLENLSVCRLILLLTNQLLKEL